MICFSVLISGPVGFRTATDCNHGDIYNKLESKNEKVKILVSLRDLINKLKNNMQNVQTLKLTRTKEAVFAAVFTALAVYTPMLVHHFGGAAAGRIFLPMPFFVLAAGLLFGWRAGFVTGLISPILSFLISGMPMAIILPFITVQLCAYGFVAGNLKERFNGWISLAGALLAGMLASGIAVLLFSKMNAAAYVFSALKDGWIGIAIQFAALPILAYFLKKYLADEKNI